MRTKTLLALFTLPFLGTFLGACGGVDEATSARCALTHAPTITYAEDSPANGTLVEATSGDLLGQRITVKNPAILNDGCPPLVLSMVGGFTGVPSFSMDPKAAVWSAYLGDANGEMVDSQTVENVPWTPDTRPINLLKMQTTILYAGKSITFQEKVSGTQNAKSGDTLNLGNVGPVHYVPFGSSHQTDINPYLAWPTTPLTTRLIFQ